MKMNRQATESDKIFAMYIFNKGLVSKVHKEFSKLNRKKKKHASRTWVKNMNRHFTEEEKQMANKHMKRCSTSLAFRRA